MSIYQKQAASELLKNQVDEFVAKGGKIVDLDAHVRFQEEAFNGNNQQQTR